MCTVCMLFLSLYLSIHHGLVRGGSCHSVRYVFFIHIFIYSPRFFHYRFFFIYIIFRVSVIKVVLCDIYSIIFTIVSYMLRVWLLTMLTFIWYLWQVAWLWRPFLLIFFLMSFYSCFCYISILFIYFFLFVSTSVFLCPTFLFHLLFCSFYIIFIHSFDLSSRSSHECYFSFSFEMSCLLFTLFRGASVSWFCVSLSYFIYTCLFFLPFCQRCNKPSFYYFLSSFVFISL